MRPDIKPRLILAIALLLPAFAAQATAPGNLDARERELVRLKFVCANNTSQQCTVQLENSPEFDPDQCPATPAPRECVIDFVSPTEIRALLTLIFDDPTPDVTNVADVRITAMLEFELNGHPYVLADTYEPGARIADWFAIFGEDDIFTFENSFRSTNVPFRGTDVLGNGLVAIGISELGIPPDSVATLREAAEKGPEVESDQSGATQPLASVARFRVAIRFARPAPAPL
jgi:hypothetical protein